MDKKPKNDQTDNSTVKTEDINRTVEITKPECQNISRIRNLHKIASRLVRRKSEIDDLIGGMNISRYTSCEPDTSAQLPAPLSNLDSRYSVLEEFAHGGQATVSIARDKNLRRVVAIKTLKEESRAKEIIDAFVSEAKVTAQLDHPAIIPIYGLTGDDKNGIHLSMKLVNGKTLRDYLRNLALNYRIKGIKSFDETAQLRKRLEIFLHVCDAIAYAHHRNIMHRDLKPENIMIGEFMEVYVVDWGLAKTITDKDDDSSAAKIRGTPRYFAPEILRGAKCDARADIFTLGLILQELVTLQFAVKGKTEKECIERILGDELEPIRHLFKRRIDKPLQAIIRKATAYLPEERYQSVTELSDDLRRYMADLSISALPDNFMTRLYRISSRYRKEFTLSIMTVLFGCAVITSYAIYRQLQTSREIGIRQRAFNYIYGRTAEVAEHLEVYALQIQEQLSALSRLTAYMLSYNAGSGTESAAVQAFRPTMSEIGRTELGMFYSPYYKRMVSLDYGLCTFAPGSDPEKCRDFIRKVSPVLTKMKNIILGSKSGYGFAQEDYEKLKTEYLYQGFPVRAVYIGSTDGVKLLYPWRGNYPRKVDPREREWYQSARDSKKVSWGKPYMDFDSISGLCIPCSVPIYDLQGNFRGVAGLDVSVNRLTSTILAKGNTGKYVLEKAVINPAGETIFSSTSKYYNQKFDPNKYHMNTKFETPLFRTAEVRDRIFKDHRGYGTFIIDQNDRQIIYSYARLEIVDMYFVVVADYEKLVEHLIANGQ